MATLKPHFRGYDIIYCDGHFYIFRADIEGSETFMRIDSLINQDKKANIYDIPSASFRAGDHYYGQDGKKYCIKGNHVYRLSDIKGNTGQDDFPLHENCRGGSHYFATTSRRGIIYSNNQIQIFSSFKKGKDGTGKYDLPTELKNGICYFADSSYMYCLKDRGTTGVGYYRMKFKKDVKIRLPAPAGNSVFEGSAEWKFISDKVLLYLPGGIVNKNSPMEAWWEPVQDVYSHMVDPLTFTFEYEYYWGQESSVVNTVESHWEVKASATTEVGTKVAKEEVKMESAYGGSETTTTMDDWEEHESYKMIFQNVKIEDGINWKVWQSKIKMGDGSILHGKKVVCQPGEDEPKEDPW